jgi:hypothetical protein
MFILFINIVVLKDTHKERAHLGEVGRDVRIILNWILTKEDMKVWREFSRQYNQMTGCSEHRNQFSCSKMLGYFLTVERLLAYQEGLFSMDSHKHIYHSRPSTFCAFYNNVMLKQF